MNADKNKLIVSTKVVSNQGKTIKVTELMLSSQANRQLSTKVTGLRLAQSDKNPKQ